MRGPGARFSADRARHNRARNKEYSRRQNAYMERQTNRVETTMQVAEKRSRAGEPDSAEYLARQEEHSKYLTIFGRKTVRDALRDKSMRFRHIYMDEKLVALNSNVSRSEADPVILEILDLIRERHVKLLTADKVKIGIISKAGKQDGGIVADLIAPEGSKFSDIHAFIRAHSAHGYHILALDQITTPANMGMIIRSAVAAQAFQAVLLGPGSVASNNPLVIKASAGTALLPARVSSEQLVSIDSPPVFIQAKDSMYKALEALKSDGAEVVLLAAQHRPSRATHDSSQPVATSSTHSHSSETSPVNLFEYRAPKKCVFVIGGESQGHDPAVEDISTLRAFIPMASHVESLNCAVTASLVAYTFSTLRPKPL